MISSRLILSLVVLITLNMHLESRAADPWADNVVQYISGTGIGNDFVTGDPYSDASTSLGEPTRFTSDAANYGGAVTPLQSAFRANEVVSIGNGGSLTVSFDEPVTDDPQNPFGIDLLVFGNSFLFGDDIFNPDWSFNPAGTFTGVASEGGVVELSDDGINFVLVTGLEGDGLYPINAYDDIVDPFATVAGSVPSDFTKPVDPALDIVGKTFAEVVTAYNGSGGGAGIDIGAWGLSQVTHVRVSNAIGAGFIPEIDGFADVSAVPEPSTGLLGALLASLGMMFRRRTSC